MTTILRRRRVPAAFRPILRAACSGVLLGLTSTACVISIHDGEGWGSDQEECFDEYGDCMDDAEAPSEFDACESQLDVCLDGFADDEAGNGDGDDASTSSGDGDGDDEDAPPRADSGDDDAPPHADEGNDDTPPHADEGESDEGEGDEGGSDEGEDDEGDTSDPDPDCFELLATCIGEAETLEDVAACGLLFEQCIDPGACENPDCGCPQPEPV